VVRIDAVNKTNVSSVTDDVETGVLIAPHCDIRTTRLKQDRTSLQHTSLKPPPAPKKTGEQSVPDFNKGDSHGNAFPNPFPFALPSL